MRPDQLTDHARDKYRMTADVRIFLAEARDRVASLNATRYTLLEEMERLALRFSVSSRLTGLSKLLPIGDCVIGGKTVPHYVQINTPRVPGTGAYDKAELTFYGLDDATKGSTIEGTTIYDETVPIKRVAYETVPDTLDVSTNSYSHIAEYAARLEVIAQTVEWLQRLYPEPDSDEA